MLATISADAGELYVVAANGSWEKPAPCKLTLKGFRAGKAAGVALSQADLDANPLLQKKEDAVSDLPVTVKDNEVTFTLPAHAVVFVTLSAK
jgi:alpha-L-arabinofuranosidase